MPTENLSQYSIWTFMDCAVCHWKMAQNYMENLEDPTTRLRWSFNPWTISVPHHIETSQLICIADQLTGFYMMGNTGL